MKRVFAVCAAALFSAYSAQAQIIEFGTGYVYALTSNSSVSEDGYKTSEFSSFHGFYLSALGSIELPYGFSFKHALSYSYLIGQETNFLSICKDLRYSVVDETGDVVTYEHYLRLPLYFGFNFQLVDNLQGYGYLGPALNYCLSSKSYATWPNIQGTNHWNVDHFAKDTNYNGYKRFDVMLLSGVRFEVLKRVKLDFGGAYGLLDRSESSGNLHYFTWHIGLSVMI